MGIEDGRAHARTPSPARSLRRRNLALAGSLVFHALALLALFGSADGPVISGAQGGGFVGPVFEVTLVAPLAHSGAASPASSDPGLTPLFAKWQAQPETPPMVVTQGKSSSLSQMMERLKDRTPSPAKPTPTQDAARDQGEAPAEAAPRMVSEQASPQAAAGRAADRRIEQGESASGSSGTLAGRMELCLRRGNPSRIPVVLEVSLDGRGALSSPPRILRAPADPPSEDRLRAEAQALSSLVACLPRGDVRFGGKTYQLEFGGH